MQPSRRFPGLILIPLLAFLLAFQPEFVFAWQAAKSTKGTHKGTKGKSGAKSSAAKSKASGKNSASYAKSATKSAKSGRTKAKAKSASRKTPKQQQPEPDRIREIQQALKDRGYAAEVTGAWDSASVSALAKFQADQNIQNLSGRGKLDSMTLIALGLGPKREPPLGMGEVPQRSQEGHFP